MYIIEYGTFRISQESTHAVAQIRPPAYWETGTRYTLQPQADGSYADERNRVVLSVEKIGDSLFRIRRCWTNTANRVRKIQTICAVRPCFTVKQYLIPCVSVNGNGFGGGCEPKGLTREGEPWVFAYDRVSIPGCTVLENRDYVTALFASDEDEDSLAASCSIVREGDRYEQELIHPVRETPVTYAGRDRYEAPYQTERALEPGESFTCTFYLYVAKPRWENFGIAGVLDSALEIFSGRQFPVVDEACLWRNSITFAKSLITDYQEKKGFCIGFSPVDGQFRYRSDSVFELAWCGQNVLFCRMLIEDYRRTGNREHLDLALEILDTRLACCTAPSGLLAAFLQDCDRLSQATVDTCNEGYGVYELLRTWQLLHRLGVEKPAYLEAARRACDFFCQRFSPEYGFGKQWTLDGECVATGGTIGAFMILPLCKLYEITGEQCYLNAAKQGMEFYVNRDLNRFCCTAGALDTDCVDKETSAPLIFSGVLLYQLTQDPVYLEYAQKAAYYFVSWMYHYQPLYGPETEFAQYGVDVRGMTSVSAQHHHLDSYGSLVVPYLRKLAQYTGDERWKLRADLLWQATLQYLGDGQLAHRGLMRPVGSQNEAIFHCRWGFGSGEYGRGDLNDWLVAWPCAFRLSVLAQQDF